MARVTRTYTADCLTSFCIFYSWFCLFVINLSKTDITQTISDLPQKQVLRQEEQKTHLKLKSKNRDGKKANR